jgi:limonene-1,2-epoxide hydrolase
MHESPLSAGPVTDPWGAQGMPSRLREALVRVTPDHPDAIEDLRSLYDRAVVFRDPIQEVRGIEAFLDVNRRLMRRMKKVAWTVKGVSGDEREIFMEWTMKATPKLGPSITVDGVTRARAVNGRIVDHRDYWDVGEMLASAVPGGARVLRALLSPFG